MPFDFQPLSFGIGFVIGILFWILLGRMVALFKEWRTGATTRREEAQARRSSGIEDNHRRITLRRAQGMHLAAPLFALDEILLPPPLMAPPARVEPNGPLITEDIVTQTLPYLPAWPELGTIYGAPKMTIAKALSGGGNLILTGVDGGGKTVALAHLATLAANRDPQLGVLSEIVPFLVHAADLSLPVNDPKNILDPITNAASEHVSFLDMGRVASFVQYTFKNGRALLLLDGFDELAADGQQAVAQFLKTLLEVYPLTRAVVTALPEQIGGLHSLGFSPLALTGWDSRHQAEFIRKWGEQWARFVTTEAWAQTAHESIDPLLLDAWLAFGNQNLTPLELTLKVWGGFAGDSLGPRVTDAISSHIRRVAPADTPIAALETLAMQVILSAQPVFDPRKARDWVKSFEPAEEKPTEGTSAAEGDSSRTSPLGPKKEATVQSPSSGLLGKMSTSGLLFTHPNNRMRFLHPVLGGYLAGRALTAYKADEKLLGQPNWGGKLLAMRYLAAQGDATRLVDELLKTEDHLLERPLLNAARWLRDAPREAAWRGKVMAGLARVLQNEENPRGLRGQAMAAFALCGDPGAAAFFRQSLQSLSFELILLAALGSGVIRDGKAAELLSSTMSSAPSIGARRAACLALVAIGTQSALEAVAHALLSGDDDLRRAAAEALANDPKEGHAMLKDGATLKDILVRRAVVYGLVRVDEPWALELLQQMQVEDDQWIVRNAATEVLDSLSSSIDPRVPRPLTPPSETPWLIEFAGKQGMGISPGVPATDLLIKALKDGNAEERLAALTYLRRTPTEGVIKSMFEAVHSDDSELREAAYQTLWELAAGGIVLPNPAQFGLA
ncbi:MAG: NACHT domain-containing protein [Anaerolineaceae bacterium]|nr:MAG: NACHT domain-containing protein [Anaerolineaceae bacterium]